MSPPRCPRCGAPMVERTNRTTQQQFWGCPDWPQCGRRSTSDDPAILHQTIRTLTRERDTFQAGYERLLTEVRQLRRLKAPAPPTAAGLARDLTRLITLAHPDKWRGEGALAHLLTRELLALRDRLKEGTV